MLQRRQFPRLTDVETAGPNALDARPSLVLRVRVTGHRDLPDADLPALQAAIDRVLDEIAGLLRELAHRPEAARLYALGPPAIRLISRLAEGADRLLVHAALAHGLKLTVPLPFPQDDYEEDFPRSAAEYAELLAQAGSEVVALDGTRAAADDAYLAVGRFVLRNCDLLVALWNGEASEGRGSTRQIVKEARTAAVPVVHIDSHSPHAVHLLVDEARSGPLTTIGLLDILRPLLLPDWPSEGRQHLLAAETHFLHEKVRNTHTPPDFLYSGPFAAPETRLDRVFPWLAGGLGERHRATTEVSRPILQPARKTWRFGRCSCSSSAQMRWPPITQTCIAAPSC